MATSLGIEIGICALADIVNHAQGLMRDHYGEVARLKHLFVLQPNWTTYAKLAAASKLLLLAAWDGQAMIGYSANILDTHLHYSGVAVCQNDVLFVDAQHRAGRVGLQLMRATESEAKARGAQVVLWHAKQGSTLDRMLGREGSAYSVQDIVYAKEL